MTIPTQAIEAGARASAVARRGVTAHIKDLDRQAAQSALTAALPALEQQIREQVAAEILASKMPNPTLLLEGARNAGMDYAAQIARGKDKS